MRDTEKMLKYKIVYIGRVYKCLSTYFFDEINILRFNFKQYYWESKVLFLKLRWN